MVMALSVAVGSRSLTPGEVWHALWHPGSGSAADIVHSLRIPRTALGVLAGLAMGAAGALTQALTRNPIADPGLLGINAGAACAVVIGVFVAGIGGPLPTMAFGLIGALIAATLVVGIAAATRSATPVTLVLAGSGLSAMLIALTSGIVLIDTASLDAWRFWSVGSIVGRGGDVAWAATPLVTIGVLVALPVAGKLNVVALGDDLSRALGTRLVAVQITGIAAVAVLAGAATAACGPIVFLGLVAPHLARFAVGADNRWVIPYSAIIGAIVLLCADIAGRIVARPGEIQAGIMLAVIGAPFLIALVRRRHLVAT
ncbi:iron ABC transporter permease [Williamsia sp. CHRR-6]|uniref:FecCD family ABC transporter permease n=1 Tax=Williamsia sp. CHRR-6 TaxID=2835871 RepID=UPI001BD95371|nr:iron ABC transporter permease [Williamsia sp. CHRR-6]MBT0566173.1 iron ABC transporter permease [Williamsia sp. CHRR-6]